jgi:hypothetical protein
MEITKEALQQRIAEFTQKKEQALGNANFFGGAISSCEELLAFLEKTDERLTDTVTPGG